jgi:rubrerythrin
MNLKGSKTHDNLKAAFAGESQANRRYLYFASKADVEGQNDIAAVFRSTAEGETGHAHGHLDYLSGVGDPATDLPIGSSRLNLKAAIAGETHEYTDMYPGMAKAARKSPTGSRRWRRRSAHTPIGFRRRSTLWPTRLTLERRAGRAAQRSVIASRRSSAALSRQSRAATQ